MAYQINLTGKEIDERLQNIGTPADNPDANGTLYARISKNADDIDELSDTVPHIQEAQEATNKTVTQHTADISALQTAVGNNKTEQDAIAQKVKKNATAIGNADDPNDAKGSLYARVKKANASTDVNRLAITTLSSANKKNQTDITDIGSRQTNIEEVVSVERSDVFFSLPYLLLIFRNYNPSGVYVTLYRWTGKRYHTFEIQRDTDGTFLEVAESYKITLENYGNDGLSYQLAITYADGTKEPLVEALKNAFGGRISHGRRKKRRWRLQAFLSGRPITAPFGFRVSVDHSGVVSLTKEGMMRSVPKAKEVVYNGFFSSAEWIKCKKGEVINCDYNASEKRFPQPGDFIESNRRGIVVASEYNSDGSYRILWTVGRTLYEIGIGRKVIESSFVFYCTSPAKKLCDDIYDYASKMSSGTLRDLYISAGAKYNETTGFYELNGLTDITEKEMGVIWQEDLSGWYLKGRTNLTRNIEARGNAGGYNGGIDICNMCAGNGNITIFNFFNPSFIRCMDNAFSNCIKLKTIDTRFPIYPYGGIVGINTFRGCTSLEEVRFNMQYLNSSTNVNFPASSLISKTSILSIIKTTPTTGSVKPLVVVGLNESAYNRLKDDTDITAALTEKNGFVTLIQI